MTRLAEVFSQLTFHRAGLELVPYLLAGNKAFKTGRPDQNPYIVLQDRDIIDGFKGKKCEGGSEGS